MFKETASTVELLEFKSHQPAPLCSNPDAPPPAVLPITTLPLPPIQTKADDASMDFHALPRRDLQALCKRNSIRANMTNAAMAEALSALPAVDGIEEYVVKQPAVETTPAATAVAGDENQGILREDAGNNKRGPKRDEHMDTAPTLGLGRCALAEPVVPPATKRRAAASKTEAGGAASEAVLVPATRRRAAVSKTEPMATRRRRAAESQTEAGDVSKGVVPAPTTREQGQTAVALVAEDKVPRARRTARKAPMMKTDMQQEEEGEGTQGVISDVKTVVPAPVSDEGEGGDEPDDTKEAMNPESEEQNEVADESAQEAEEILGAPMETATPVEEEPPLTEDCTDSSSVQEWQVDVKQREDLHIVLGLVEQQECAPFREGPLHDEAIHHTSEEAEIVPVKEEAQTSLKSLQTTKNLNEGPTFSDVFHTAAKANEAGTEHGVFLEEEQGLTVHEVLHDTRVTIENEVVLGTNKMPLSSETVDVEVEEVFSVNDLSQLTATDVEGTGEERVFTGDLEENEAGLEDSFVLQEKEGLAVDEVMHDTDVVVEDEGVVATDNMPHISVTVSVDVEDEVFTIDPLSQLMATEIEDACEESAFAGDLPPVFCDVYNTSPLFARMPGDTTKSVSMDSNIVEAKVSEEAVDVSPCMYNSYEEKNIIESVAAEPEKEEKEVSKFEAMGNLSLRKLRLKYKETVAVGQENEVKEGKKKSRDSFTLEPYVSEEASDASLCVFNNSNKKKIAESVGVEQEKGLKQGNKSEGIGELSLRKLGLKSKEKVAVGQENEVKEGKKSMALDKLSLRQLRTKLRETLNAHKSREPNRTPLGRLDENVC